MNEDILTTLKILIIGESGVGKSSLLLRFTDDTFDPEIGATIGYSRSGTFSNFNTELLQRSSGCYPGRETFAKLDNWLNELDTYCTRNDLVKMLVGNKIDKEDRELEREEGLKFARKHSMLFIELVEKILQTPGLWESVHKTRGVALSELSETGQGGCGAYCSLL
ncbi:Ras-related protein Rab-18 [Labeo rohita]|uniref:Ras-related protein Rab-18 n=1 Tax=Labeo rohita TaxID=84645 RepID=A0ABQ8M7C6_LABRO|nr:Ras-related protein Rab-18 [Labeo rohita]